MKLEPWRGNNVLITDRVGLPVLLIDRMGNVVEWEGLAGGEPAFESHASSESLAESVATWIEWTADEPCEFRGTDIHPQIRARVEALAPGYVER